MTLRTRLAATALGGLLAAAALAGPAIAAPFPEYGDCPWGPDAPRCLDVRSTGGTLDIAGRSIPLGGALRISGALDNAAPIGNLIPSTGTTGVESDPIPVPGGLFQVPGRGRLNALTIRFEGVGARPVSVNRGTLELTATVKLKLANALVGDSCTIGTDADPLVLHLTAGTTAPPLPNLPISGRLGPLSYGDEEVFFLGSTHVDNAFAVPAASGCSRRAFDRLLNWRFDLASPAGRNAITLDNDLALSF